MPEPYDFRGIVMICNVFAPDTGKAVSFSVNKPAGIDAHLPFLTQMTVKETISGFNEININLAPPTYGDALKLLESSWLTIGNTISVRWGYTRHSSHITPWHHAFMLKPDISFGDEFAITLKGTSFGWIPSRFATQQVWSQIVARKGEHPPRRLRKDIIEEIAKRYNFVLYWNGKTSFKAAKWEPYIGDIWSETKNYNQGGLNDLMYCKKLAAEAGCRLVLLRGNEMHINSAAKYKDPDYRLVYRGQVDIANNVFPIDTFDSDSTPLFLPRTGISQQWMNPNSPKSKLFKKYQANEQTVKDPIPSGKDVANPDPSSPKVKTPDGKHYLPHRQKSPDGGPPYFPITPKKGLLEHKVQNMFRVANSDASLHGISATCSGPDIPNLLPETMVKVDGVGRYFSVVYRVFTITHTIGSEFAKMDLDLKPKGFPGDIAKWLRIKAPKPKKYDPSKGKKSTSTHNTTLTDPRPGSEFDAEGGAA